MSEYLKEIKSICDQLFGIGSHVSEKMKIFAELRGLGRDYEPIITYIEGSMDTHPGPTYQNVVSRLNGYGDRLRGYASGSEVMPHLAYNTIRTSGYSNRGRGQSSGRYGNNCV